MTLSINQVCNGVAPAAADDSRATTASPLTGLVEWGPEISEAEAIVRRMQGNDIVVRGDDLVKNRGKAEEIEKAVGPYKVDPPHKSSAGPQALPHCQQITKPPFGHCFYETQRRKAKRK